LALSLNGIDHVHVYVSDRTRSQKWYEEILGFHVLEEFAQWATESGPLTMEDAQGSIHLALFESDPLSGKGPDSTIAFNASGENLVGWKRHLEAHGLEVRLADHDLAWSIYFHDPDRNYLEITSYDHAVVAGLLEDQS
jgi:catechol 2,3-dioxygenase-like lactoylglutathione lyase family enzyme